MIEEEPVREVSNCETLPRPGGGFVEILTLACGHQQWRKRRTERRSPPKPVRCVSCWLAGVLPPPPPPPGPPPLSMVPEWDPLVMYSVGAVVQHYGMVWRHGTAMVWSRGVAPPGGNLWIQWRAIR